MSVSLCYYITENKDVCGIKTKLVGRRDICGTVSELLGAGIAVALWVSYLEQGWLWHCDQVTWSRDGCGTVTELVGAGMAVAL